MSYDPQIHFMLEDHDWTFAKTMPHIPHYWTAKRTWDPDSFDQCVRYINTHGVLERFRNFKPKRYLYLGEWRYWTMSEAGTATIINRCNPENPKIAPFITRLPGNG